ncbi:hypothetical protein [Qipengyuania sp. MTN3-11]|uniref:hypothetical protein n=1 Tax=Qipengyuania sp. MTN3-11 TaxID=3056557 RepID=UPI0036F32814
MPFPYIRPALMIAAAMGLGACSTSGYDNYYGSRVSVGYGAGSYAPYYGWYDDYYYPGTGYYVWDRRGYRHSWSDRQRNYWIARRTGHRNIREQWRGYNYNRRGDYVRRDHREVRRYGDGRRNWDRDDERRERYERARERGRDVRDRNRARAERGRDLRERNRARIERGREARDQQRARRSDRRGDRRDFRRNRLRDD